MQEKILQFDAQFKALSENDEYGEFEGYGSVFGEVDFYNEVVLKGAFEKSIKKKNPVMLWQHRMDTPIGKYTEVREDDRGLYVKGQINLKTQKGVEAYSLLKQEAISGMSIGYYPIVDEYDRDKEIRYLKEVDLLEISIVTFPANEQSNVVMVRSLPQSIKEFERFLRDAGYSRNMSKAIASKGFSGVNLCDAGDSGNDTGDQREAGEGYNAELLSAIKSLTQNLKGITNEPQ